MNEKVKVSSEESLSLVYKDMLKTVICLCVGWALLWFALIYDKTLFVFIGMIIAAGPLLPTALFGGGLGAVFGSMFRPSYEVVTKDASGRVVSRDGGSESLMNNIVIGLFIAVLILIIGIIIQIIRLIILIGKYIYFNAKATEKPVFLKSGFFLIVLGFAVLIGAPIALAIPYTIHRNIEIADARKRVEAQQSMYVKGAVIVTRFDEEYNKIREKADQESQILITVPLNTRLTILDDPVKESDGRRFYFPVEYQGVRGWIYEAYIGIAE